MALPADRRSARAAAPSPPTPRSLDLPPRRAFVLPILFTAGLLAVALSAPLRQNPRLLWSSLGPGLVLLDKLLQVPLLNLSIRWLDRVVRREPLRRFDPAALRPSLAPGGRHLAYIGVWAFVFAAMSAAQGVGDRHRGQGIPFWQGRRAGRRPDPVPSGRRRHQTAERRELDRPRPGAQVLSSEEFMYGHLRKEQLVKRWEGETIIVDITRKIPPGDRLHEWYRR